MIALLNTQGGMTFALVLSAILLLWGIRKRSINPASRINMDDFLLGDDGKISSAKFVLLGSFLLNSWLIVYLTLAGKIDHEYVYAFSGVYAIPAVAKILKGPAPTTADTTTITATTTTVNPTQGPTSGNPP